MSSHKRPSKRKESDDPHIRSQQDSQLSVESDIASPDEPEPRSPHLHLLPPETTVSGNSTERKRETIIVRNKQLREEGQEAIDALLRVQQNDPSIFVRGKEVVCISKDHLETSIVHLDQIELRCLLSQDVDFYEERKGRDGELKYIPTHPPVSTAEYILARTQNLPFPQLQGLVQAPVVRPDGSILDQAGYDKATYLYYVPADGLERCIVPDQPSQQEREQALALAWEAIGEFCYVSEADRANALALLLTPLLRPAIAGHIPMALIDAYKAGSGKTMLAQVVSLIATGREAAGLAQVNSEDEWDKRILSTLMEGKPIVLIDNVARRLESSSLEEVLTMDTYQGRVLGVSRMARVPNRATWIATGNRLTVSPDLSRRCYRIQMDAGVSQPWRREGFTHPDLIGWVKEQRVSLLQALLTLIRAWYAAGQPVPENAPTLGTFTNWARTLSGVLVHAGVTSFLSNLDKLYETADDQSAEWTTFLTAWYEATRDPITVGDLIHLFYQCEDVGNALPDWLKLQQSEKPNGFQYRLGRALAKIEGVPYGPQNLRVVRATKRDGYIRWIVRAQMTADPKSFGAAVVIEETITTAIETACRASLQEVSGDSGDDSTFLADSCFEPFEEDEAWKAAGNCLSSPSPAQPLQLAEKSKEEKENCLETNQVKQSPLSPLKSCEPALQADLVAVVIETANTTAMPALSTPQMKRVGFRDQLGREIDFFNAIDREGNLYTEYFEVGGDNLDDVTEVYEIFHDEKGKEVVRPYQEEM